MRAIDKNELIQTLCAYPLFRTLSRDDLEALLANAVRERHQTGVTLFRQGENADRFFAVLSGWVALYVDEVEDTACIARIVGPGETFAEGCVCDQGTYPVTAKVIRTTDLVGIPRADLCRLLEERFDLVLSMLTELSIRLRGLIRQITDLKMKTAAQRLAGYLLTLTDKQSGAAEICLPYEKRVLAQELCMKPETLSRALLKLQPLGVYYKKSGNALQLADLTALRCFCEPAELAGNSMGALPAPKPDAMRRR